MIDTQEKYIPFDDGFIFVKHKFRDDNSAAAIFLPGSTLSPRNFWDCELPEGGSLADRFVTFGVDVIMVDPIGYGSSIGEGPPYYTRTYFAEQLDLVAKKFSNYNTSSIVGFCATTFPPLISLARDSVDRAVLLSPNLTFDPPLPFKTVQSIYRDGHGPRKHLSALLKRFATISDRRLGRSNKFFNWYFGQMLIMQTYTSFDPTTETYQSPGSFIRDGILFPSIMKSDGIDWDKLSGKEILIIDPEFEVEVSREGFASTVNHLSSYATIDIKTLEDSTHFPMWEHNRHRLVEHIVRFIVKDTACSKK